MERASKTESIFCNKRFVDCRVFRTRTLNPAVYATQTDIVGFLKKISQIIFTARRYATAVYAVVVCLYACVCLSQAGVLSKELNFGLRNQRYTIAEGL